MQERVERHFPPERRATLAWFFAGGGAYTQPRAIRALTPAAAITVAELDPLVTRIAAERLYVEPADFTIHHGDARATLAREPPASFDVVVTDAFHDIAIPYHLVTREYAALVRSRLRDGGLLVTNVVDAFPDPSPTSSTPSPIRAWSRRWSRRCARNSPRSKSGSTASRRPRDA